MIVSKPIAKKISFRFPTLPAGQPYNVLKWNGVNCGLVQKSAIEFSEAWGGWRANKSLNYYNPPRGSIRFTIAFPTDDLKLLVHNEMTKPNTTSISSLVCFETYTKYCVGPCDKKVFNCAVLQTASYREDLVELEFLI